MNEEMPVSGEILRWARERGGFSLKDVAERFKKEIREIEAWESNKSSSPTYVQLEKLADLYKRPIVIFFFPEPPDEQGIKKDLRTLPEHELEILPPRILYLLRKAQVFQMNLQELFENQNPASKLIFRDLTFSLADNAADMAIKAREYLAISLETQKSWRSPEDALKHWRTILETYGLFVFKDTFRSKPEDESAYSGFCLYDENFPVIYLNNNFPKTRQIFTLFHELAHILFSVGGVDKLADDSYIQQFKGDNRRIEILCNQFASEFLTPAEDINARLRKIKDASEEILSSFAKEYHVSREVILRRMLDLEIVNKNFYQQKVNEWRTGWGQPVMEMRMTEKKRKGGDHYKTKISYLSQGYMNYVFARYYQKRITLEQAADYLDTKPRNMNQLENSFLLG